MTSYRNTDGEAYHDISASVDTEGNLRIRYRVENANRPGSESHDENVSSWSDDEVRELIESMLGMDEGTLEDLEIDWE